MKLKLFLPLFFVAQFCSAQISFQKYYGYDPNNHYMLRKILPIQNGDLCVVGISQQVDPTIFPPDILISRMNQSGDTLWTRIFGDSLEDHPWDVIQTPDSGFAIIGQSQFISPGTDDMVLLKVDQSGNLQWSKYYGGTGTDRGRKVLLTESNGFALIGNTSSFGTPGSHLYFVKTDSMGNLMQGKSYDYLNHVMTAISGCNSYDGSLIMAANVFQNINNSDIYLCKIDSSGNVLWSNTYGGLKNDVIFGLTSTPDSGFIMCGYTLSFNDSINGDMYVTKLDSSGNPVWSKTYGSAANERANSIENTNDNGFVISGFIISGNVAMGMKIDSNGNILWSKQYGNNQPQTFNDGRQTPDSGFVFAGDFYTALNYSSYVVKTNSSGISGCSESNFIFNNINVATNVTPASTITTSGGIHGPAPFITQYGYDQNIICLLNAENEPADLTSADLIAYPNPFRSEIEISFKNQNLRVSSISVKNILGQIVYSQQENAFFSNSNNTLNLSFLTQGIYFLDAEVDDQHIVKMIMKQ